MQGSPFVSYVFVEFGNNSDLAVDAEFGKNIFDVSFDSMYAYAKFISDLLIFQTACDTVYYLLFTGGDAVFDYESTGVFLHMRFCDRDKVVFFKCVVHRLVYECIDLDFEIRDIITDGLFSGSQEVCGFFKAGYEPSESSVSIDFICYSFAEFYRRSVIVDDFFILVYYDIAKG